MIHGEGRYRAGQKFEEISHLIDAYSDCDIDLADYLRCNLEFSFSKVSAGVTISRCEQIFSRETAQHRVRAYCLQLKARLTVDILPYLENRTFRAQALKIAEEGDLRVVAAVIRVNWVVAALSKTDAGHAAAKLAEARTAVGGLTNKELRDPDAFGIKARLEAHRVKVMIHEAAEGQSKPSEATTSDAVAAYDAVCLEVQEYDHLRANYKTELADELHKLAKRNAPGALEAAHTALQAAHTSLDSHACNLCRRYFHEVYTDHHLLKADRLVDWAIERALSELESARAEAESSLGFFTIAEHPSAIGIRRVIASIEERIVSLEKPRKIFLSHRGADKALVWRFHGALAAVNFLPWLDDAAMPAGTKLHRGLQRGMQESCSAVFFITPDFIDEGFLAKEIDYAVQEEMSRPDTFKIIALVLPTSVAKQVSYPTSSSLLFGNTPPPSSTRFR